MSNSKKKNARRLHSPKEIELVEKHFNLRVVLLILALVIGVGSFAYGVSSCLSTDPGWHEIEAEAQERSCSVDFTLQYCLGQSDLSATAENRQLTTLYTELVENGYRIFTADEGFDGLGNLFSINANVNQETAIDPALYEALALADRYDFRYLYLAPVWQEYEAVFLSGTDAEAQLYDPTRSEEMLEYFSRVCEFINDPEMISLELLGENRVRLNVADAYLSFAEEWGIETFLDFGWMANAFIADYMADSLQQQGFTNGYLVSYDGFTRNLDERGEAYSQNVFDLVDNTIYLPARIQYDRPIAMVNLRSYPMIEEDRWHYFSFADGTILTLQVDTADGLYKSAVNDLLSYSYDMGCAEVLMQVLPLYIADSFDGTSLNGLTESGVHSVWSCGGVLYYNDPELTVTLQTDTTGVTYKEKLVG